MAKKQHSTLRLKTYTNVYTDKKRVLQIAIMDQYGRIFETFTNDMKTFEQLQKEWGESNCGRSVEKYVFDELTDGYKELQEHLQAVESRAVVLEARTKRYELINAEYIEALREAKELKQAVEALLYWMDHYCPPSMTTQKQAFERVKALLK